MNVIEKTSQLGQSIWYDNIQRSLLNDGSLNKMIQEGVIKGVTSNPSIFQKAISDSTEYDVTLKPMSWAGMDAERIFWQLAVEDIRRAADLFLPIYQSTKMVDGYVSLEVNPLLAHDTKRTIQEAQRLWDLVNRPNLMIKIPATVEGIDAIRTSIAAGININVTLIFSIERYKAVMEAFIGGIEQRLHAGKSVDTIDSVASFFVSRVDSKVDGYLNTMLKAGEINSLLHDRLAGKAAIANARLAYDEFKNVFSGERYAKLKSQGVQVQRPLWASTSTKNPTYRDVLYVEELIGKETVNTVPPATLAAFADHGRAEETIQNNLEQARSVIEELEIVGIPISKVTQELEDEGVKAFADSFNNLITIVEGRRKEALKESGSLTDKTRVRVNLFDEQLLIERIFQKDPTVWTPYVKEHAEIKNRLSWLQAPWKNEQFIDESEVLLEGCIKSGIKKAVLLGMGGSSLAPEVLSLIQGEKSAKKTRGLKLTILDSTDPDQVKTVSDSSLIRETLFIVSSKSGSTGEINAFLDYFWHKAFLELGAKAGDHFIAITDPGTQLADTAKTRGFRKVFSGDPGVGGRYSALTAFGLIPAVLIGLDARGLLENARSMAELCRPDQLVLANPGAVLGAMLGEAALAARDKFTIITDQSWNSFGNWLEQLVAESSGKKGRGIVPIANEPAVVASGYGQDRFFVYIRQSGEKDDYFESIRKAGHPAIILNVNDSLDLGGQFYLWEIAVAIACSVIGVNAFDQPDVQDAKIRTIESIEQYKRSGAFEEVIFTNTITGAAFFTDLKFDLQKEKSIRKVMEEFLRKAAKKGDYIAINAFLPRNTETEKKLQILRHELLEQFQFATTLGFGPRFLHSTGQLHKGGANNGIFLIITANQRTEILIPNQGLGFGVMQRGQAIGDYRALEAKHRRILWIDLVKPDPTILWDD